jgi:transcriptional regulator with XRE-family HTH domain
LQSFLFEERQRLGLSQKEVFDFLAVNKATYYRWERGAAVPSDKLAELRKLGFDINFVVSGVRESSPTYNPQNVEGFKKLNHLASERKRLSLTQKEVCEAIDVSKGTYIRWEDGYSIPSDKLEKLAGLGFDINFVVTGERQKLNAELHREAVKAAFNRFPDRLNEPAFIADLVLMFYEQELSKSFSE